MSTKVFVFLGIIFLSFFFSCSPKYSNQAEIKIVKNIINKHSHLTFKQTDECLCNLTLDYLGEGIGAIQWSFSLKEIDKIKVDEDKTGLDLFFENKEGLDVIVLEWLDENFTLEEKQQRTAYDFVPFYSIKASEMAPLVESIRKAALKCGAKIK